MLRREEERWRATQEGEVEVGEGGKRSRATKEDDVQGGEGPRQWKGPMKVLGE